MALKYIPGGINDPNGYGRPRHPEGTCSDSKCQSCCEHQEFDHYMCLDCGYEKDPGEDIDRAMDAMEDQ